MEHKELVERAVKWLRSSGKNRSACGVVVPELVCAWSEQPDAIGWSGGGRSIMVECKASRADFLADKNKPRQENGVGLFRFYMCPPGLITAADLPPFWGLLYCQPDRVTIEVNAPINETRSISGELAMMYSLLRRVEVRGQLQRCLSPKWGGDFLGATVEQDVPA